jgi:hypothetical protein
MVIVGLGIEGGEEKTEGEFLEKRKGKKHGDRPNPPRSSNMMET